MDGQPTDFRLQTCHLSLDIAMESEEENNVKAALSSSDSLDSCTCNESSSGSVNYGSEMEGTDVENSDAEDEKFSCRWPKLVRAVYTCSDDEEEYEKSLECFLEESGSDMETSSESEVDNDRLSKQVYREPYSDSDEYSETDSDEPMDDTEVSKTPECHKFEWKPLEHTMNNRKNPSKRSLNRNRKSCFRYSQNKNFTPDAGKEPSGNKNNYAGEMSTDGSQDRREKFCDDNIGPTKTYANAYEAFTVIWDEEVMELIVTETNRYARQSKIDQWQDTTMDEMYVYLGMIIICTVRIVGVTKEYWFPKCEMFGRSNFPYLMPYKRFKQLTNCIHFCDNTKINDKRDEINNSQAKLFKLQPLLNLLNEKFSSLYNIGPNIVLDEGMTQWKGWIVNTRKIGIEPDPVEIKSIEISEPNTGYLWKVKLVPGDITTKMIPGLVVELLNGLEYKGHTLWVDKFYSSPFLARQLKKLGFDCAGLLKKSYLPAEVLERVSEITSSEKKKGRYMSEIYGGTSGDVDVFSWITKNRCTSYITTYHGAKRVQSDKMRMPKIMLDYNRMIQGIHRKDNLLFQFPTERKHAHIWYKMFFRKLLNASVLNAHILYNKKYMKHYNFRRELCNQIFITHSCRSPPSDFPSENTVHTLVQYGNQANSNVQLRNKCYSCDVLTEWYCNLCILPFCNGCFGELHNNDVSDDVNSDDSDCNKL